MDPKQLMLLAAAAVGAYVLFFRGGTASAAGAAAPAPSPAVTGGYSSPAIVGLPVPQVSSGGSGYLFIRPDPAVLQAQAAATTAAYAASGFEGHTAAPLPAVSPSSPWVQPNGQYLI
ncbi:hypothetical protein [Variovorax sp. UMC13]|uniref:hypothetical protein n=1 Tax=Variovorax sp. UMC13 TaxID=1862326 RepID=UPI0016028BD0|nr:hypothetical protein [Variovorax sp. UMC13]